MSDSFSQFGNLRGVVADELLRRFEGLFREGEQVFDVLGPVIIAPRDPERVSLVIFNVGGSPVFLRMSTLLPAGTGIRLLPNGGGVAMGLEEDGILPSLEWFAESGGSSTTVYVLIARRDVKLEPEF